MRAIPEPDSDVGPSSADTSLGIRVVLEDVGYIYLWGLSERLHDLD